MPSTCCVQSSCQTPCMHALCGSQTRDRSVQQSGGTLQAQQPRTSLGWPDVCCGLFPVACALTCAPCACRCPAAAAAAPISHHPGRWCWHPPVPPDKAARQARSAHRWRVPPDRCAHEQLHQQVTRAAQQQSGAHNVSRLEGRWMQQARSCSRLEGNARGCSTQQRWHRRGHACSKASLATSCAQGVCAALRLLTQNSPVLCHPVTPLLRVRQLTITTAESARSTSSHSSTPPP